MNRFDIALNKKPPPKIIIQEPIQEPKEVQYHGWIDCRVANREALISMG
jgi:hypothetical protein